MAGKVALEAAGGFAAGLAFLGSAFDVGDGCGVPAAACDDDLVEGAVEFAVAAAVESVTDGLAGGGGDWGGAGEAGEGGFVRRCDRGVTRRARFGRRGAGRLRSR